MKEVDRSRCLRLAFLAFGKSVTDERVESLMDACETVSEFRVSLVIAMASQSEAARAVLDRWRSVERGGELPNDANALATRIRNLVNNQDEIEAKIQNGMRALLDQLSELDKVAAGFASCKSHLEQIRRQIAEMNKRLSQFEPVSGDRVVK